MRACVRACMQWCDRRIGLGLAYVRSGVGVCVDVWCSHHASGRNQCVPLLLLLLLHGRCCIGVVRRSVLGLCMHRAPKISAFTDEEGFFKG